MKVKGTIDTFIKKFPDADVDVVYIDGANSAREVLNDILKSLKNVKPKVAVGGHDFTRDIRSNWNVIASVFPWKEELEPESGVDMKFRDSSWLVWTDKEVQFNDFSCLVDDI